MSHPAFPTSHWHLEPHQEGILPVAASRGGPIGISWEIHGEGPLKMVVSQTPCLLATLLATLPSRLCCGQMIMTAS
jgi:hypothetical protein